MKKVQSEIKSHSYKAAQFAGNGKIDLVQVEQRPPEAGEVRIKMEGCGVCASNLPMWEGRDWFQYPSEPGAPGHEGWGIIEEVGSDVNSVKPGDRVAALSYHAYAEIDYAAADQVVPLPKELKGQLFPAEPLGCAVNIFGRSDIKAEQSVAVIGVGFLGALLTQLAKSAGAKVIAISRRQFALDVAKDNGANETITLDDKWQVVEKVKELTGGNMCQRVLEVTGYQMPLDLAGEITGTRGKMIIAGFHQDGPRQVDMQSWNWKGIDVINAHERDPRQYMEGIKNAIQAVVDRKLQPDSLITHRFSLKKLDKAFELMQERPEGFLKAVMEIK